MRQRYFRRRPLPEGGLYRRSGLKWLATRSVVARGLALVAVLIMWVRQVSHRYLSGTSSRGALHCGHTGQTFGNVLAGGDAMFERHNSPP